MEIDPATAVEALDLAGPATALILAAVTLAYTVPVLVAVSALVKLRRFPALRALHRLLLTSTLLIGLLALIEGQVPVLPDALRASGTWAFVWAFAVAWLAVTWTRSAIKTRLRPRALDLATLTVLAAALLAVVVPMTLPM